MSASNYQPGQVLTAAALNASFDGKTDNESAAITGGTIEGIETLEVSGTEDSTSVTTGAVVVAGGVGIALDVQVGGGVTVGGEVIVNSTQASSSTTTGALVVAGGAGVGGNVNVGGAANVTGALSVTGATNLTGALAVTTINVQAAGTINLATGASIVFPDGSTQTSAGGNSEVAISTTGGTTIINATQSNGNIFKVTGALTSNAILVFPASAKAFIVDNATTGAFSLTIEANGQSPSVVVPQGKAVSVFTDSTGAYAAGSTGSGIGFTSIVNPNASIALTAQQAGAYVMQQTAGTTTSLPQASTLQAGQGFLFKDVVGGSILSLAHVSDNGDLAFPFTCTQGDEYLLISDGVSHWYVALHTNNVWVQVTGGIIFPDGTRQTTANGTTQPTSTWYTVGATNTVGSFAAGDTAILTSGFNAPFVDVIRNGLTLTRGQHYTLNADGLHINFIDPQGALTALDQIEVKTKVVLSPSTAYVPQIVPLAPTVGSSTITYAHTQGFSFLQLNGQFLVPGTDYTDSATGFTLLLTTVGANDQWSTLNLSPVTIANMLAGTNPTIVGGALTFADSTAQNTAALLTGQARLTYSSATALLLSPCDGNLLYINGTIQKVPSAGVTLANTGLSASTQYFVYAYMVGSVMTLEAVTTAPFTATNGIVQKTGDPTRSLVGMCYTSASSQFQDVAQGAVGVLSYFCRRNKTAAAVNSNTTSSTTFIPLVAVVFLAWSDEAVQITTSGNVSNTTNSNFQIRQTIDGTGVGNSPVGSITVANSDMTYCLNFSQQVSTGVHNYSLQALTGTGNITVGFAHCATTRG
jgi:hypothetical protein